MASQVKMAPDSMNKIADCGRVHCCAQQNPARKFPYGFDKSNEPSLYPRYGLEVRFYDSSFRKINQILCLLLSSQLRPKYGGADNFKAKNRLFSLRLLK